MSQINPILLEIKRASAHKVFEKKDRDGDSDHEEGKTFSNLPEETVNVIKSRLIQVLGSKGKAHQLEIESFEEGSFFKLCSSLSSLNQSEFIDTTLSITGLLAQAQKRKGIRDSYLWIIDAEDSETKKKGLDYNQG